MKNNSTPFSEDIVFNCQIHFYIREKCYHFFFLCLTKNFSNVETFRKFIFPFTKLFFSLYEKILSPIIDIHSLAQNLCKSSIFSARLPDGPIASTDTSTGGGVLLFRMMTMMVMMMIRSMIKIIITTTMMIVCSSSSMDEIKKNEHFEQL